MRIPPWFVGAVLPPLFRLWSRTLRITEIGRERVEAVAHHTPFVLCLWHGEFFPLISAKRDMKLGVIVSQSNDGEYIARVLQSCGFSTPRGSSSRGGTAALRCAANLMRQEHTSICITVDGPRGPRHKAKAGAIRLSRMTEAPIIPARAYMERCKVFHRSWDKFQLPLPFSRATLVYGEPRQLAEGELTPQRLEAECAALEHRLHTLRPPDLGATSDPPTVDP
jgi:lysophospholipid acyltransferase (LPLAT)-like uncharacterized protein